MTSKLSLPADLFLANPLLWQQDAAVRALDARHVHRDAAAARGGRGRAGGVQLLHGHLGEPGGDRAGDGRVQERAGDAGRTQQVPDALEALQTALETRQGTSLSIGSRKTRAHGASLTLRKCALFRPCRHLDFEWAVTAQNDTFKAVLIARIHAC